MRHLASQSAAAVNSTEFYYKKISLNTDDDDVTITDEEDDDSDDVVDYTTLTTPPSSSSSSSSSSPTRSPCDDRNFKVDYDYLNELAEGDTKIVRKWKQELGIMLQSGGGERRTVCKWYLGIVKQYQKTVVGNRHCVEQLQLVDRVELSTAGYIRDCAALQMQDASDCIK